jgi:hypothetical protein
MIQIDVKDLRSKLDLEGKYVDFSVLRTALAVEKVVRDLDAQLTAPTKEGECRGKCPKCGKDRSFSLNVNTNRFNCFAKGCILKGGGVIDLIAKLWEVPAKEASHLLACAYGIQPYTSEEPVGGKKPSENSVSGTDGEEAAAMAAAQSKEPERNGQEGSVVSRAEFEALAWKVERLSILFWSQLFENSETSESAELFDEQEDCELKAALSV